MTITTFVLAITGVFGGGGGEGGEGGEGGVGGGSVSPPKAERTLKERLNRLADALQRLAGKAVEALFAIFRSVVGAILSFLGKAVGFVAEHTWALNVFVAGLIGVQLMQKVSGKQAGKVKK